jgi:hypothetical protein
VRACVRSSLWESLNIHREGDRQRIVLSLGQSRCHSADPLSGLSPAAFPQSTNPAFYLRIFQFAVRSQNSSFCPHAIHIQR